MGYRGDGEFLTWGFRLALPLKHDSKRNCRWAQPGRASGPNRAECERDEAANALMRQLKTTLPGRDRVMREVLLARQAIPDGTGKKKKGPPAPSSFLFRRRRKEKIV
jgi:hypothetical protein